MGNMVAFLKRFSAGDCSGDSPWPARIFICLAVLISYASVWPNEFVFDDKFQILFNDFLKHWSNLPKLLTNQNFVVNGIPEGFYRPIQMLIYFLIYQAFGPSTIAFHALNISLHALNACLLHHFGIRAGFRKGAAFTAALLWAVHPLHTSDVAYISSTAELLRGSFCLLGLITLLPDFTPRRSGAKQIPGAFAPRRSGAKQILGAFASRKIWQAMIFFMLALGCKESAVVFPALAAATLFFTNKDRARFSIYLKTWPLWLLAACYIAIWLWFIHKSGYTTDKNGDPQLFQYYTSNFLNRVLTSLATLPVYARLIVWPAGLHIERSFPTFSTLWVWPPTVISILPAAGLMMAGLSLLQILWGRLRRNKYSSGAGARRGLSLSFGLLWFAVALSPVTGIVIPADALISESWMYLPVMGLFLGVAQTAAGFFETRQNAARLLVLVMAFSLGITTFFQNEVWRSPETLYRNVLQNGELGNRLCPGAGIFYMQQGEFDKAIEPFKCTLNYPDRPHKRDWAAEIHLQLAMAWLQVRMNEMEDNASQGEVARALPSCQHIPEAIGELGKALQADPDFYWAHIVLADIYQYQGNNQMVDFHLKQVEAFLKKQGGH